ncbi:ATP-dependent DNA helicase [Companilactobacillus alimentarius]|uniref:ATP-dependent DNA helicase n=1 Tax=Companilactobacillus alimentarius TaxID=1602 RepID=UPI0028BBC963|nr:ATP-dependent DNA helicase [Companilactobacillus alimentarius]MDT6952439.1 ATP-dependent DNA helicase [Companilactobacillus alimentarius]
MTTKIGIRQLVEFVLRSGDLNETKNSQNTALNGARIHRRLQKLRSKDSDYESEVYLKTEVKMNDTNYLISGRADGILLNQTALIEEIKTSDQPYDELSDNTLELYWGQVKVYGYLLLKDHPDLDRVTLRLTYFQVSTEEITTDEKEFSQTELDTFFQDLIHEYEYWLVLRAKLRKTRNDSIKKLAFPFPKFRTGQHELAAAVYKTIYYQKRLFVEAPTGTGKTISTLFPAIKSMGEEKIQRLFYLTAKQSTRHVAEDAITLMEDKGLKLKSITLTAKDKIRFIEQQDVLPEKDPFMIGYYDRLKPALADLLTNEDLITRDVIEKYARNHTVDPFEFSLDASLFCDVIICDYNYLFDPLVYLQRFFIEKDTDNFFLIDEAHNLVSRSRAMYSASISDQKIASLLRDARKIDNKASEDFQKHLKKVRRVFNRMKKVLKEDEQIEKTTSEPPDELLKVLGKFDDFYGEWMSDQKPSDFLDKTKDFFFDCLTFVKIGALYNDTYKTRLSLEDNKLMVKQLCLDPSDFIDQSLNLGLGAVLFSATLSPMEYYQNVLGGSDNSLAYRLPSPFPVQNQEILITQYIQTTYRQRKFNQEKIVMSLKAMIDGKRGNYLFFFPSYGYLQQIRDAFVAAFPKVKTATQTNAMDNVARQAFLDQFQSDADDSLVGFCVLGGIFSEGIDLRGDRLIGVAIVSVGLPGLSAENNLIRDYYDQKNGRGFEYAYQMPGMNNVLQAAGRLIRGSRDTGIILLLDQRFTSARYTKLFPQHWRFYKRIASLQQLSNNVDNFWKERQNEDKAN